MLRGPKCTELLIRVCAVFVSLEGKKITRVLLSSGSSDMDKEMIPKFSSKDEELDYWKSQALKYKKR